MWLGIWTLSAGKINVPMQSAIIWCVINSASTVWLRAILTVDVAKLIQLQADWNETHKVDEIWALNNEGFNTADAIVTVRMDQ